MTTPESFRETWRNIATTFFKLGITSYGGGALRAHFRVVRAFTP